MKNLFIKSLSLMLSTVMVFSSPLSASAFEGEAGAVEADAVETVSVNEVQPMSEKEANGKIQEMGYHTMDMSAEMLEQKSDAIYELSYLSELTAGEDYDDAHMMVIADTYEEAVEIADCYGATLSNYLYGVGTIDIKPDESVEELLTVAASDAQIPALYVNYMYSLDDCLEEAISEDTVEKESDIIKSEEDEFSQEDQGSYAALTDPESSKQWQHTFVNTTSAWDITRGSNITVAVIDTGMDIDHEDLLGDRFLINKGLNSITGKTGAAAVNDDNGHGTHVSGIIAATADNDLGGVGIAPECNILPIKVLNASGSGYSNNIVAGVNYAATSGVDVINLSLGGSVYDKAYEAAIKKADKMGTVVVAAAGNDATDAIHYPSSYSPSVCVASLEHAGLSYYMSYFSNFQSMVDIAAPGSAIYSTTFDGKYDNMSGTSMACPVVAGVVALIRASSPGLKQHSAAVSKQVKSILLDNKTNRSYYLWGSTVGYGNKESGEFVYGGVDASASTYAGYATGVKEIPAPTIKVENTDTASVVTMTSSVGKIKYIVDNGKLNAASGKNYTGSFELGLSGKHTIKAITVIGNKCSKVTVYTGDFVCKTTSVFLNSGRNLPVVIGGTASIVADVYPLGAADRSLTYECESSSFVIDEQNQTITCKAGTVPGTTAELIATTKDGTKISDHIKVIAVEKGATMMTLDDSVKGQFDGKTLNMTTNTLIYQYDGKELIQNDLSEKNLHRVINLTYCIDTNMEERNFFVTSSSSAVRVREIANEDTGKTDIYLYAINKGNAKITVTANDGSGYSFSFDVKVITPIYDIRAISTDTGFIYSEMKNNKIYDANYGHVTRESAGRVSGSEYLDFAPLAREGKIKLTTYINDDLSWKNSGDKLSILPDNKGLVYESSNPAVTVKNGVVTCSKTAPIGELVYVKVKAADGYGSYRTMTFKIFENPGKLVLNKAIKKSLAKTPMMVGQSLSESSMLNYITTSTRSANVYPYYVVEVPKQKSVLRTKANGSAGKAIVYVGSKKGSGKITYKTVDGSNKKVSIKIKVAAPKSLFK